MNHKRQAWVVMIVAFLASITTTVNQFKVPPVLPAVAAELHLDAVASGWLMSVFSVAAVILSIPAALLLGRLGFKIAGVVALACAAAGSLLGALAPSAAVLLVSRVIEGISIALMGVVAPALISRWFRPQELGLPMGLWATWVPVGSVIAFNLAPLLERGSSWRAVWWFGAALSVANLVLYGLVARPPSQPAGHGAAAPAALRAVFTPGNWLLGLAFGSFAFALVSYNTWAPSFLSGVLAIPPATASFYASLIFLAGIVANLVAGWAMNRVRHRYALLVSAFVVTAALFWWAFRLPGGDVVVPYMLAIGFASNFIPTAAFTLAPETVRRPELAGLAMAVLGVVSNVGMLIGPPLLGALVGGRQWSLASGVLVAAAAIGAAASLLAWRLAAREEA